MPAGWSNATSFRPSPRWPATARSARRGGPAHDRHVAAPGEAVGHPVDSVGEPEDLVDDDHGGSLRLPLGIRHVRANRIGAASHLDPFAVGSDLIHRAGAGHTGRCRRRAAGGAARDGRAHRHRDRGNGGVGPDPAQSLSHHLLLLVIGPAGGTAHRRAAPPRTRRPAHPSKLAGPPAAATAPARSATSSRAGRSDRTCLIGVGVPLSRAIIVSCALCPGRAAGR